MKLSELLDIELPCGGNGKCGRCRVKVGDEYTLCEPSETERKLLGELINDGWRLACMTEVIGESVNSREKTRTSAPSLSGTVCVDIGTTTLEACVITEDGTVKLPPRLNPQRRFGSDVISRIGAVLDRCDLTSPIRYTLADMLADVSAERMIVTGNTVMLHLFAGLDVSDMACDPFEPASLFGCTIPGGELGFDCDIYLPRCVSAFVGADTTCALLAADIRPNEPTLLVDLGTNGELAYINGGEVICCSTASGPALEAAEISCGMRAEVGAIERVEYIAQENRFELSVIGGIEPRGICGSGLISAVAALRRAGIIDESGYLAHEYELAPGVTLTQGDIRAFQLAKSAIASGIAILTEGKPIERLCVAGNFGSSLELDACLAVGLLPDCTRVDILGNAALAGAVLIAMGKAETASANYLNLAEDDRFAELFAENMLI